MQRTGVKVLDDVQRAALKRLAQGTVAVRQLTPTTHPVLLSFSHGVTAKRKTKSTCPFYSQLNYKKLKFVGFFFFFKGGDMDLALSGQGKGKLSRQPSLGTRSFW